MPALEILKSKLIGNYLSNIAMGDCWTLRFQRYSIVAQNIISKDEELFNNWMDSNYPLYRTTVDKVNIAKCAILASYMRRLVTDIHLDGAYNLGIQFEDGGELVIPVTESVVDWQWALNMTGKPPYSDYLVACFFEGEIDVAPGHK